MTVEELEAAIAKSERIGKELGSEVGLGTTILWPYNPRRRPREHVRTPFGLCRVIGPTRGGDMLMVAVKLDQMRKTLAKIKAAEKS